MQASTWKKKNFCSMYLPQFYLKPFFDPGERKKKQETFRQIGCVEKRGENFANLKLHCQSYKSQVLFI